MVDQDELIEHCKRDGYKKTYKAMVDGRFDEEEEIIVKRWLKYNEKNFNRNTRIDSLKVAKRAQYISICAILVSLISLILTFMFK